MDSNQCQLGAVILIAILGLIENVHTLYNFDEDRFGAVLIAFVFWLEPVVGEVIKAAINCYYKWKWVSPIVDASAESVQCLMYLYFCSFSAYSCRVLPMVAAGQVIVTVSRAVCSCCEDLDENDAEDTVSAHPDENDAENDAEYPDENDAEDNESSAAARAPSSVASYALDDVDAQLWGCLCCTSVINGITLLLLWAPWGLPEHKTFEDNPFGTKQFELPFTLVLWLIDFTVSIQVTIGRGNWLYWWLSFTGSLGVFCMLVYSIMVAGAYYGNWWEDVPLTQFGVSIWGCCLFTWGAVAIDTFQKGKCTNPDPANWHNDRQDSNNSSNFDQPDSDGDFDQ